MYTESGKYNPKICKQCWYENTPYMSRFGTYSPCLSCVDGSNSKLGKATLTDGGMTIDDYEELFCKQYGDLPCGEFILPEIEEENDREIIFRCHYENFELEEDVWHYGFDKNTKQFYAA